MTRLVLMVVCIALLGNYLWVREIAEKVDALSTPKSLALTLGTLRGDFQKYKLKNARVWSAQERFNKTITNKIGKFHRGG